jgi:NADPH-dependent ferric siderophore reductase
VRISRPAGGFVTHPAPYHVFAGDAPAAAAFGPMIRGLPDDVPVYAVIETGSGADRLPFTRDVAWVPRAELGTAVKHLPLPDEPGAAYLAGEARLIQQIRSVLIRDRGWPRRAITTKPFWTPGKRALR